MAAVSAERGLLLACKISDGVVNGCGMTFALIGLGACALVLNVECEEAES